jgi:alpha-tubulin suppressor-like RCC1 family protein
MSVDEMLANKALIWACGRNADGELGLGFLQQKEGEVNIPRNIE